MFRSLFFTSLSFVSFLALSATNLSAMEGQDEDSTTSLPIHQTTIEFLPEEVLLHIFASINQRDVPSVAGTCKQWEQLMNDQQLWKVYAQRAQIDLNGSPFEVNDYKALLKDLCKPSFTEIKPLEDGSLGGISPDGSMLLGEAKEGPRIYGRKDKRREAAFTWTSTDGLISLGVLNNGSFSSAVAASADNSVVVGNSNDGNAQKAFRWTQTNGMESLGTINNGYMSEAMDISADSSVIVGSSIDGAVPYDRSGSPYRAFRWTKEGGMESIGTLNNGSHSKAEGISSDSIVIVGLSADGTEYNQLRAFRWTGEDGMKSLGILPGANSSAAYGVNSDGSVIVGGSGNEPFVWTLEGGMKSLGALNNGKYGIAHAVSGDGLVVGGSADDGAQNNSRRAFLWTARKGMRSLEVLLMEKNLLPPHWRLSDVVAISSDGTVLTGRGHSSTSPQTTHIWRAVLSRATLF